MGKKIFSLTVLMMLLLGSFALPAPVFAWSITPQEVTFVNGQGITLNAWVFKPAGSGVYPAIVLMHGCSGVYSYSDPAKGIATLYREWGDRLVAAGYVVLLVDSFTPRNTAQNLCNTNGTIVSEVNDRPYDAYAALSYLASQPNVDPNLIGLLGWSHGGSSTFASLDVTHYNALSNFKAAVAFYPGCELYGSFGGLTHSTWQPYAPFVILHGSADTTVSAASCQSRVSQANALGATNTDITLFANAQHSFDLAKSVGNGFTQYDVDAKIAADQQTMQFFGSRLHTLTQKSFRANSAYTGYVLESAETSGVGGRMNHTATTLRVGDDAANRQYRSLLHFDTSSLPDGAWIVTAKLRIKNQCVKGANPFLTHGSLLADIRKGNFGSSANLELSDFQNGASLPRAGVFNTTSVNGWHTALLDTQSFAFVDPGGATQFRLRFLMDDNNDNIPNYVCFYSGSATTTNRPILIISYYLP